MLSLKEKDLNMDNNYEALVRELYSQLNGDARHDGDVLMAWAERFRGDAGAKLILAEIGRLLYFLDPDGAEASVKESIDKTLRMRDGALSDAELLKRNAPKVDVAGVVSASSDVSCSRVRTWRFSTGRGRSAAPARFAPTRPIGPVYRTIRIVQ